MFISIKRNLQRNAKQLIGTIVHIPMTELAVKIVTYPQTLGRGVARQTCFRVFKKE